MDNLETLEAQRALFEWIPLARYMEMFPEETASAIRQRRRRGFWLIGVHISVTPGMGTWINLREVKALIEKKPLRRNRGNTATLVGEKA
jgi:hypothetical protein